MHGVVIALLLLVATHAWGTDQVRLARYSAVSAEPERTAMDPLAVMATVHFPREHVRTVGDAVAYLLVRTGYRLASTDPAASALLALPLPESHRVLGPYAARAILDVLVGEPFQVMSSPVERTIAISLGIRDTAMSTVAQVRAHDATEALPLESLE